MAISVKQYLKGAKLPRGCRALPPEQLEKANPDSLAQKCHLCKEPLVEQIRDEWEKWDGHYVCENCHDKKMAIAEAKAFYVPKAKRVKHAKAAILEAIQRGEEIPDEEIAKVILRGLRGRNNALDELHSMGHGLWRERLEAGFAKAMAAEGKRALAKDK
jgi:hypothetical protein